MRPKKENCFVLFCFVVMKEEKQTRNKVQGYMRRFCLFIIPQGCEMHEHDVAIVTACFLMLLMHIENAAFCEFIDIQYVILLKSFEI